MSEVMHAVYATYIKYCKQTVMYDDDDYLITETKVLVHGKFIIPLYFIIAASVFLCSAVGSMKFFGSGISLLLWPVISKSDYGQRPDK
jgi:hypothetical protein